MNRERTRITRRALASLAAGVAGATAFGCAAIFGIDEPQRDPCADGACEDGGAIDAGAIEAGGSGDAARDTSAFETGAPDQIAPNGIRCGAVDASYCTAKSICCETDIDAALAYTCVPSSASCSAGYPIECASAKDCTTAGSVCCYFHSGIKCEPATKCTGTIVCDPNGNDCPAGKACNVPLLVEDPANPYLGCAP